MAELTLSESCLVVKHACSARHTEYRTGTAVASVPSLNPIRRGNPVSPCRSHLGLPGQKFQTKLRKGFGSLVRAANTPRHKTNTCRKLSWRIDFCANACGYVFALAQTQEKIFEELFSTCLPTSWGNSFRCKCKPRLHLPPCEYRKNSW